MTSNMFVRLLHNLTYPNDTSSDSLMTKTFVGYSATHPDTNSSSSW